MVIVGYRHGRADSQVTQAGSAAVVQPPIVDGGGNYQT